MLLRTISQPHGGLLASYGRPSPSHPAGCIEPPLPAGVPLAATAAVVKLPPVMTWFWNMARSAPDSATRVHVYPPSGDPAQPLLPTSQPVRTVVVERPASAWTTFWWLASAASAGASGYHGMKRNHGSIGWGLWWAFCGGMAPVVTPAFAVAQGYGEERTDGE